MAQNIAVIAILIVGIVVLRATETWMGRMKIGLVLLILLAATVTTTW